MTILKTEITALKQQHAADQHEIRTKDDRIDQLIREIRNLVSVNSLQTQFVLQFNFDSILPFDMLGRKMRRF